MTTEREPLTIEQLTHDLADARTIVAFLERERDQAVRERNAVCDEITHYVAAVTDNTLSAATLHLVLARLGAAERELVQQRKESAARQAECIRLGEHKHLLIEALSFCLTQCRASGHLSSEPHIQQAFAAIATARGETPT